MKTRVLFLILLSLFSQGRLTAQKESRNVVIKGTVHDVYRGPIANAIVMIDGKKTNEVTDSKGFFSVKVRKDASRIGIFTFGNGIKEEFIDGRRVIDIDFNTLSTSDPVYDSGGEEAVNTGYSYVKRKNLTNNISKISGSKKDYSSYSSIYDMIQREVPGVRIIGNSILIHESANIEGYIEPLFVIDGVYAKSVEDIKPATVESIEILKDASASIYGYRAYGGVILIKTKLQN